MTSEDYIKSDSGLIYRDYEVGKGDCPKAGQQVFSFVDFEQSVPFLFGINNTEVMLGKQVQFVKHV